MEKFAKIPEKVEETLELPNRLDPILTIEVEESNKDVEITISTSDADGTSSSMLVVNFHEPSNIEIHDQIVPFFEQLAEKVSKYFSKP